jgi:hypothetical protein
MKHFAALSLVLAILILSLFLGNPAAGQDESIILHLIRDRDSLAIYNPSDLPVSISGLELRTLGGSGFPQSGFDALSAALSDGMASPRTCYVYVLDGTAPPTPGQCLQEIPFKKVVPPVDTFWYDFNASAPRDIAIWRAGQFTGITCPGNIADCSFAWLPVLPTATPTVTPLPVEPIIENGVSNLGTIQIQSLENILNQTGIQAWRDAGWTGAGQRIGVLDRHFGGIARFQEQVVTRGDFATYNNDNLSSGTDILDVIHRVAPGAQLFACRYTTDDEFSTCVDWLIAQGMTVIDHAAGAPVLRLDESSRWSQAVAAAAAQNTVWIEAAGNYARGHRLREFRDNNGNGLHEFRGINGYNEVLAFAPIPYQSGTVMLAWESSADRPVDLDLLITDPEDGLKITDTVNLATGAAGGIAVEYATLNMDEGFGVQIHNTSGRVLDETLFS